MSDNNVRGQFVWHELMTTNTRSAADFFTKVVGWTVKPWEHDPSYMMFMAGGRGMAGLMGITAEAKAMGVPPSWCTYIGTPDVDATARQAEALGGKVLKAPADIATIGRFAVIQNPQGASFLIFTPRPMPNAPQPPDTPPVGDFSWHELVTTDWRAALTFYQTLFGWETTSSMDMGEMGTYQMFGLNGKTFGGFFNKPATMPGPPFWLPYIKVADAKKAAATTARLGGRILNGPMEVPGGDLIAQGMDLQGAAFAVHSAKAVAKAAPAAAKKPTANAKPAGKARTAAKAKAGAPKKAAPKKARPVARKKTAAKAKAKPVRVTKAAPRRKAAAKAKAAPTRGKAKSRTANGKKKTRR